MSKIAELDFSSKTAQQRWQQGVRECFWGDLKKQTLIALKALLTSTMEIQIQDLTNAKRWQRSETRLNYRNGYYVRNLLTSFGHLESLKVPRLRRANPCLQIIPRYKQRTKDVDQTVLEMFLSGVSTRRVEQVLKYILGDKSISATSVSNITKQLDKLVARYHARQLTDDYRYLIVDGVYISSKSITGNRKRCVLVAYGISVNGKRELIDYELARKGESECEWSKFLNKLSYKGFEGKNLQLAVVDGNKGAYNAINLVYPFAKIQRCWAHKLRNVSNYLNKKVQASCINQARNIYNVINKKQALQEFKLWRNTWQNVCPKAVRCLEKDIDDMLHFFDCPKHMHKKLRTTNIIERVFREVRRRTKPIGCFTNERSVERIVYAIFYRQNKIWERKALWKSPCDKYVKTRKFMKDAYLYANHTNPKFTQKF